ncbi:DUF664 domain-containing protein, partial [Ornithinimicrobium sp. W1679]|uniref:mycothiol transferase n=1 Tax=Ornithinimicrobium sp. W1679 TaxID=3418770 RepID=UPI003CE9CFA8
STSVRLGPPSPPPPPPSSHGRWERAVARSRSVVEDLVGRGPEALGRTYPAWDGQAQVTLRWLLTHMVEEYARHNGHADLLRELVDGQTGE